MLQGNAEELKVKIDEQGKTVRELKGKKAPKVSQVKTVTIGVQNDYVRIWSI